MSKKIILFDVDKTLIDTTSLFKKRILTVLYKKLNLTQKEYQSQEDAYQLTLDKYTDFDSFGLLKFLTKQEDIDQLHQEIFGNKQFYLDSVFKDVVPILEQLKSEYRLGIFSEAVLSWQEFKLKMADLTKYFEPEITFIFRRKTEPTFLKTLPKNAIIIDDNPTVIKELEKFSAFKPIWINRVESKLVVNSATITSLSELPKLLTTLGKND